MDDCLNVIKIIISFIISFNVSKLITIVSIFYVSVFPDFVLFSIYDFIILLISHVLSIIISASMIFILIIYISSAFVDVISDDAIKTILFSLFSTHFSTNIQLIWILIYYLNSNEFFFYLLPQVYKNYLISLLSDFYFHWQNNFYIMNLHYWNFESFFIDLYSSNCQY